MQPATRKPFTEAQIEEMLAIPDGDKLIAELEASELWKNNRYTVQATRREDGSVIELSIRRNDRRAARDWREFQRIKNEIAGRDVEAVELFPAEDRLMDTANQYFLWCLPPGEKFPMGFHGRNVRDHDEGVTGSVQRPLPDDWKNQENGVTT